MPTIRCPHMTASFHDRTGHWEFLRLRDGVNLLHATGPAFGLSINGRPALPNSRRLVTAVTDPTGRACDLLYVQNDMRIVHRVELHNTRPIMKQSIIAEVLTAQPMTRRVTDIWLKLPGLALDDRRNNFLHVSSETPRPYQPLQAVVKKLIVPSHSPALIAMENRAIHEAEHVVAAWQRAAGPVELVLSSENSNLNAEFHIPASVELLPGTPLTWSGHFLSVASDPAALLDASSRESIEF